MWQWQFLRANFNSKYACIIENWISIIFNLCNFFPWTLCFWFISLLNLGNLYYTAVFLCGIYCMMYAIKLPYLPCTFQSLQDWSVNMYYMKWTLHSSSCVYQPALNSHSTCFDRSWVSARPCRGSAFVLLQGNQITSIVG